MIHRDDKIIIPKGNSILANGDIITVLGSTEAVRECRNIVNG